MKLIRTFLQPMILLLAAGQAMPAQRPGLTVETTLLDAYVWRGLTITRDAVLQTSSTVSYRGTHLNVFTNQDLTHSSARRGQVNELDFDLGYDYTREKLTASCGLIRYTFPNTTTASTTELYTGVALAHPLHPSVRAYFDVGAIRGAYFTFDAYHAVALPRLFPGIGWEVVLAAGAGIGSAGHNAGYYGVHRFAAADLHPSLALPVSIKRFRVTPRLGCGMMLDRALRRAPADTLHGFFAAIGLSFSL